MVILAYEMEVASMNLFASHDDELRTDVKRALEDWQAAQNYFENVSDPDLIDFAIYDLEAAKRKYMYMLKKIRMDGEESKV